MNYLDEISPFTAFNFWNNFLTTFSSPVPFSFNPSLFYFYENYFHWKPYYFLLFKDKEAVGLLPLVNTGKTWVSLPHFSYGGFAINEKYNKKFNEDLIQKIILTAEKENINQGFFCIDINKIEDIKFKQKPLFIRTIQKNFRDNPHFKVSSIICLPETKEELLLIINKNLKRKINKAKNSDLEIKIGNIELLDDFYNVYSKKMHELGSPAYGKDFFKQLFETYSFGDAVIFRVQQFKKTIGAAVVLSYNGFYESAWFATDKSAYKNYVSDYLHWQIIKYAIDKHAEIYSFGRSTFESSVYIYKNHWPVTDLPIYYYNNKKNHLRNQKWISNIWKKTPCFITNSLGPKIVEHFY